MVAKIGLEEILDRRRDGGLIEGVRPAEELREP